jgi:hypothetical protein
MSASRATSLPAGPGDAASTDVSGLFHRLNNQLGIILANAELLESRVGDATHRARAGQVVASVLDAIDTVQRVRRLTDTSALSEK